MADTVQIVQIIKNKMMEDELKPYKIISTTFLGRENGNYTYEIVFNQSMVHTGRWRGIEEGLDAYREREMKDEEQRILDEANRIRKKYGMSPSES